MQLVATLSPAQSHSLGSSADNEKQGKNNKATANPVLIQKCPNRSWNNTLPEIISLSLFTCLMENGRLDKDAYQGEQQLPGK